MRFSAVFSVAILTTTTAMAESVIQPQHIVALSTSAIDAASQAGAASKDENSWDTEFGRMSFRIAPDGSVTGEYPQYSGRLKGKATRDGLIDAVWIQPSSKRTCATQLEGSSNWGRVQWKVVDNKYLRGGWAYCDDPMGSGGSWNGDKPSTGKAFASFFSTLIRVAGGVAGSQIGGGIGGNIANMALSQATDSMASAVENGGAGGTPQAVAQQDSPAYPSMRNRRLRQ